MGDDAQVLTAKSSAPSVPQLEDSLWKTVTQGKLKNLERFVTDHSDHPRFNYVLNSTNEEVDEDGGNIIIHCVRVGRDKGSGIGKDHGKCLELLASSGANLDGQDKSKCTALGLAVSLRYRNYVTKLLKLGASVDIEDQDDITPFEKAIQKGYKDILSIFIEYKLELIDLRNAKGVPPLVIAVRHGQLESCRLLLEKGADINTFEEKTKRTPVFHAIRNKRLDILELFLKYKPNVETIDCEGYSILFLCCESSDARFFQKIIQYCHKFPLKIMDQTTEDEKTALIMACQCGNSEQVKHLLEEGSSVKAKDSTGKTGLHYCADNLETQCAEMLLEKDRSIVDYKDEQGYTVLSLAVLVGNINLMKLLLDKGADINTQDNEGHKLTHWAAVTGHLKALDLLIQHKADLSSCDSHQAYPIHYAAQMNSSNSGSTDPKISEKVLKKLIDCKVKLDVVDDANRQPLIWAACSGNAESCKLLLKAGANINALDKDDLTAMHCAASRGHFTCIEVLRKNGADVNLTDKNKCTPLFYAITLGNKDCTKALITAGANVNHVDDRGRNPVHCAAIKGCLDTLKVLEKEKADLWHQNKKGDYPIHEAAQKGHLDVVKYLLRHKNDKDAVNVTNQSGKTLLHIAAATNNLPLCKLLMNYECNKNALMKHAGKEFTPYDLAVIKQYQETADFLKNKGALPHADLSNIKRTKSPPPSNEKKPEVKKDSPKKKETPRKKSDVTPHTKPPPPSKKESETKKEDQADSKKSVETKTEGTKAGKAGAVVEKSKTEKKEDSSPTPSSKESPKKSESPKQVESPKKSESPKQTESAKQEESPKTSDSSKKEESPKKSEKSKEEESPKKSEKSKQEESTKQSEKSKQEESPKKSESPKRSESPKKVDFDKSASTAAAASSTDTKEHTPAKKKPSADSVVEKADGIRTSRASLQSEETERSSSTKEAEKNALKESERGTSTDMGGTAAKEKKEKKDTGKYVALEKSDLNEARASPDIQQKKRGGKVGFRAGKSDNEDSGNETDSSRPKRYKKVYGSKNKIGDIQQSVKMYQNRRNQSRGLQQLKRAQMHTAPMHDIVMFSKMMDNYRRGFGGDEEDLDIRSCANWDGYLNSVRTYASASRYHRPCCDDQLRFMSNIYRDDSKSPRELQDSAKEYHRMLETEARNRKKDTDTRVELMRENQEREKKYNADMDREIDGLARRTAEMFDNVKAGASSRLSSAKTHNSRLKDDVSKARELSMRTTSNPEEREMLEREELDEELAEQQRLWEKERKEKFKNWHRRKDDEMRKRLLAAYRPHFPNDVFNAKSVCVSGGRVKSASLRMDPSLSPSPRLRRTPISPRPASHKSDASRSLSQYKPVDDKTKVQMTPYGLRRIRNQERPSYDRRARVYVFKSEFEIPSPKLGYDPEHIIKTIRELESQVRRKYPATYRTCICGATRLRRFDA